MTEPALDSLNRCKTTRLFPGPGRVTSHVIEGTLTARDPLHVGVGLLTSGSADNLLRVARERQGGGEGRPYVPATALRGVLRSWCEMVLSPFGAEVAGESGEPFVDRSALRALRDPLKRAEYLRDHLDLVSGLFGCTDWRGKLRFQDARLCPGQAVGQIVGRFASVCIDSDLGSAAPGMLFEVEGVMPGTRFEVCAEASNTRDWELGMILSAFDAFNDKHFPLRIGGRTQQGFGRVQWDIDEFEDQDRDAERRQTLKSAREAFTELLGKLGSKEGTAV